MEILIEVIGTLVQFIWMFTCSTVQVLWENRAVLMDIKGIASYLTPAGMIAALIGVPVFIIHAVKFGIKKCFLLADKKDL